MSYLSWHVGMKVVCINDSWKTGPDDRTGITLPVKGETYTIREVGYWENLICIRVTEIKNPERWSYLGPFEAAFTARRFRPVQTRKTDISVFTAMLDSTKSKVPA